jgi:hypothetical protein
MGNAINHRNQMFRYRYDQPTGGKLIGFQMNRAALADLHCEYPSPAERGKIFFDCFSVDATARG